MVVIVDLDEEVHDPHADPGVPNGFVDLKHQLRHSLTDPRHNEAELTLADDERPNPNINGFSAALSCYPIVSQLASLLDLNSLHALSRTCRQFRVNLLQYRKQLVNQSLRCVNEAATPGAKLAERMRASHQAWASSGPSSPNHRITSGKIGKCARDMVGECQRCGTVVCRNCTIKHPPPSALNERHRRLCRTCTRAPLAQLTAPRRPRATSTPPPSPSAPATLSSSPPSSSTLASASTSSSTPPSTSTSTSPSSSSSPAFTAPAFQRAPCSCPTTLWLCQPCGHSLRSADTSYSRGWAWRTRYAHYLGGASTGIGAGNSGVACGRGGGCLAAKAVEHETDCDVAVGEARGTGRCWRGASYLRQEVEGVGGVVRAKVRRRVWVGAVVREREDERGGAVLVLDREVRGVVRSWCAWCERVVLGKKDLEPECGLGENRPVSSSGSSGFSVVVGQ